MAQAWYEYKQDVASTQSKMKSLPARVIKRFHGVKWSELPILTILTNRHKGKLMTLLMNQCIKIF